MACGQQWLQWWQRARDGHGCLSGEVEDLEGEDRERCEARREAQAVRHTAAGHKEARDVFSAEETEAGSSAEGGAGLERVAGERLMVARDETQCASKRR